MNQLGGTTHNLPYHSAHLRPRDEALRALSLFSTMQLAVRLTCAQSLYLSDDHISEVPASRLHSAAV